MSTGTPVNYFATNVMCIRDLQTKIAENAATIKSDVFFCRQDPQLVKFRLGIAFGHWGNPNVVCVFVEATQNVPKAKMRVTLYDDNDATIKDVTFESQHPPPATWPKNTHGYTYVGYSIFDLRPYYKLVCVVEYEASLPMEPPNETSNKSLHGDLLKLLESSENADVTFLVKGAKIKAHKAILGARSDYFKRMFDSGMKESVSEEVDIQDSEPDVFTGMLQYLYSGLAPKNLAVIGMDLLAVSDKYGLDELKRICESNICSNLTAKTVVDALILADRHACEYLMRRAKIVAGWAVCMGKIGLKIRIQRTNIGAVKRSKQDWEKLRSHADLPLKLLEIFCDIEDDICDE